MKRVLRTGFILILLVIIKSFIAGKVLAEGEVLQATTAKQWQVVELPAFTASAGCGSDCDWDEFPLEVTFTHQGGTQISVDGYYDGESGGNKIYKVRFAPTREGIWNWQSYCPSDSQMDGMGGILRLMKGGEFIRMWEILWLKATGFI